MNEDYSIVKKILDKDGIQMERIEKNKYSLSFSLHSDRLYLKNLLTFDIIKILYEVNKDIFDDFSMSQSGERAEVYFLIKHFFSDFGLPQKYMHLNVEKIENEEANTIIFVCQNQNPDLYTSVLKIPSKGDQMEIELIHLTCKLTSDHCVEMKQVMFFDNELNIPSFVEKMAGTLISKTIMRVKQFIENFEN
jgi:hypothetical protein